jgi:chaperonin cofactor prefoldin
MDANSTLSDHRLVIDTLKPLPQERKCFRMVNGVLVERTVEEVLPTLQTNSDGLQQVLEDMLKQYKSKQTELDSWKVSLSDFSRPHCIMALIESWYGGPNLCMVLTFSRFKLQKKNNIQVVQP